MDPGTIVIFVLGIVAVISSVGRAKREVQESKEALHATNEDCDAMKALYEWEENNPGRSIWNDPAGRKIILRAIKAHFEFQRTHSYVLPDDGRLECLCSYIAEDTNTCAAN